MAPSAAKLREALIDGTCEVYKAEPDGTSVNKVRRLVENKLGLEDGFFTTDKWKQKSKAIIKEQVDKLLQEEAPEPKSEPDTKFVTDVRAFETESPQPKRRKRAPDTIKKKEESDAEDAGENETKHKVKTVAVRRKAKVEDSDGGDASEEETKPKFKKAAARRKPKVSDSDEEDALSGAKSPPPKKRKRDVKSESEDDTKPTKTEDDSDGENGAIVKKREASSDEEKPSVKTKGDSEVEDTKPSIKEEESKPDMIEEDEYSDVIDEPLPTRRKKKEKKETASKSKPSKPAPKKAVVPDDPNEAEMKKLQSQLSKCGVRKLWHMELKQHGNDAKAKIRHLKKMLADIGMDGRFSEAKAREIKEMRELRADVEAAQEMNRLWGMNSGGRASRSKSKNVKVEAKAEAKAEVKADSDMEEEVGDEEAGEGEPASFAARRRKAHAELAFLGDESDSG